MPTVSKFGQVADIETRKQNKQHLLHTLVKWVQNELEDYPYLLESEVCAVVEAATTKLQHTRPFLYRRIAEIAPALPVSEYVIGVVYFYLQVKKT